MCYLRVWGFFCSGLKIKPHSIYRSMISVTYATFSKYYFLSVKKKTALSQDLLILHGFNLYSWYRTGFWCDWFWSVEVRPIGHQEFAFPVHLWFRVSACDSLTVPRVVPAFHAYPTSHSFSSRASRGGGKRGSIQLAAAQADEEEGPRGIRPLSCCLTLTVPRGWRFTYPSTNLNCCGAKRIITTGHVWRVWQQRWTDDDDDDDLFLVELNEMTEYSFSLFVCTCPLVHGITQIRTWHRAAGRSPPFQTGDNFDVWCFTGINLCEQSLVLTGAHLLAFSVTLNISHCVEWFYSTGQQIPFKSSNGQISYVQTLINVLQARIVSFKSRCEWISYYILRVAR